MGNEAMLQRFVHDLKEEYSIFYDVKTDMLLGETPLKFAAQYRRLDERYMVSRKAKIWKVENQEVVFVHTPEMPLSKYSLQQFHQDMQRRFSQYIPQSDHMSSVFIGMIITDKLVSTDVIKEIKKYRKVKFIQFGMNGWAEFYIALIQMAKGKCWIHPKGKQFIKRVGILKKERVFV